MATKGKSGIGHIGFGRQNSISLHSHITHITPRGSQPIHSKNKEINTIKKSGVVVPTKPAEVLNKTVVVPTTTKVTSTIIPTKVILPTKPVIPPTKVQQQISKKITIKSSGKSNEMDITNVKKMDLYIKKIEQSSGKKVKII
jgi:hypothetical protein